MIEVQRKYEGYQKDFLDNLDPAMYGNTSYVSGIAIVNYLVCLLYKYDAEYE